MRRRMVGLLAATVLLGVAGASVAAPPVRITAFRVLAADGRTPASQPLSRGATYVYRLDYRIGGRAVVRVRRAGTFWSPYGDALVDIAPRPQLADPGRYFASDRIRVARSDSPGEYRLTYAITASGRSGTTRRTSELRMRFK